MIKKLTRPLLALVVAFCSMHAPVAGANVTPAAPAPELALMTATGQICGLIKDHFAEYKGNSGALYSAVEQVLVPRFDVSGIARLVLAANYRAATPEQRTRFAAAFKEVLVHTYANALLDNCNAASIDWKPTHLPENATDAVVNAALARADGRALAIGFRVHVVDADWKIYDIAIENVSLILNFRTQINAAINGTSLDKVIARMESGR